MTKQHWAWVLMLGPILFGFLVALLYLNPFLFLMGLAGTLLVHNIARDLSYEHFKELEERKEKKDAN
jgi:hypothetical protein